MFQKKLSLAFAVVCVLAIGFAQPSFSDGTTPEYSLPHLQPSCAAECADFVAATPVLHPDPEYRSDLLGNRPNYAPEGFVLLRYVVGTDGRTHDITPIIRLGHPKIADLAIDAVKGWTFTPATQKGKPVAQMLTYRIYLHQADEKGLRRPNYYTGQGISTGELSINERQLALLIKDGKSDEARALLRKGLAGERLPFWRRNILSLQLIKLAKESGDYLEARHYAVMATATDSDGADERKHNLELGDRWMFDLWTDRLNADLALGEIADAQFSFQIVKQFGNFRQDAGVDQRFNEAVAKADAAPQLLTRAVISSDAAAPIYWHALYRNTFKFAEGAGGLDRFSVMCDNNMMEGQVSFTAQWRLPATWRNCVVFVSGTPGSTFGVIETKSG
jgi:hypothetical protein